VRRAGSLGWLQHDVTHRGVTAWLTAGALLSFYFGLYLSAEVKRLAWWAGAARPVQTTGSFDALAGDALVRLTLPGGRALLLAALVGAVVGGASAYFRARDAEGALLDADRRDALRTGAKSAALTLGTLYGSALAANVLEPAAQGGRHLLPAPGAGWSTGALVVSLGLSAALFAVGARGVLRAWGDRARVLQALTLPLVAMYGALLVLLYGTHALAPAAVPSGERSLRAFASLLYAGLDSKWSLYGLLYSMAVTAGGVFVLGRYAHNRYQVVRTLVVMGVQVSFGFTVPVLLAMFAQPAYYLSYFWPLKIDAFYPDSILRAPAPFVFWSFVGSLVLVPVMGFFFGKRWYCSWVCGCGGLANTAGEPWRHLSQKGSSAWRFERVSIHVTLVLAVLTTLLVVLASWVAPESRVSGVWWGGSGAPSSYPVQEALRSGAIVTAAAKARYYYGVGVTAVLSGAIGVGLYPLGGTRQWCRNFCPMAAMLGLVQKLGRYRIRVKADMCISCGMCTTYCEMGIDVRSYAQANQSFTRASCVGCGMCAEVCPRGVLSLEQTDAGHGLVPLRLGRDRGPAGGLSGSAGES
jgi:ferredoxin-type protein NapH